MDPFLFFFFFLFFFEHVTNEKKKREERGKTNPTMDDDKIKREKSSINQYLILWVRLDTVYFAEN